MTLNRMYHCVPSTISGESQMFGVEVQRDDQDDRDGEEHVGREGGQELRDRLHPLGPGRAQADPDADRHPDQAGERDQHQHADQVSEAQAEGGQRVVAESQRLG